MDIVSQMIYIQLEMKSAKKNKLKLNDKAPVKSLSKSIKLIFYSHICAINDYSY